MFHDENVFFVKGKNDYMRNVYGSYMAVFSAEFSISTKKEGDMVDISGDVADAVIKSGISNGIAVVFVPGSTAAITTIEYEPGLVRDLPDALERIAPVNHEYHHEEMWHDGNGRSHVRASLLKPDLTVPFMNGKVRTGTWQQIVLVELDIRPRKRTVMVQIIGE